MDAFYVSLVAQPDYHLYFKIQRTEKHGTVMCYVMLHQLHISLFLAGDILSGFPTHLLLEHSNTCHLGNLDRENRSQLGGGYWIAISRPLKHVETFVSKEKEKK